MLDPIISTNGGNRRADPEISEPICITQKGGIKVFRRRVLVGWTHQDDTPRGRRNGKVWCWVAEDGASFRVYDAPFNRSEKAEVVRFCGVANFTMVRMFHPYWSRNGQAPRDMRWSDKRWCRRRYSELMERRDDAKGNENSSESSESDNDRHRRRRAPRRSTGRKRATAKTKKHQAAEKPRERSARFSSSENDRWAFPDSESDSRSSEEPLISRKRQNQGAGIDGNDSEELMNPRARTEETPVKAEGQDTVPTGDTENYGGVIVEALPVLSDWEWKFEVGERIDLDPDIGISVGNHQSNTVSGEVDANDNDDNDQVNEENGDGNAVGDSSQVDGIAKKRRGEDNSSDDDSSGDSDED